MAFSCFLVHLLVLIGFVFCLNDVILGLHCLGFCLLAWIRDDMSLTICCLILLIWVWSMICCHF